MMRKLFFISTVVVLLTGCATPSINKDFDLKDSKDSGLILGSITYDSTFGAYIVHVVSDETKASYRIQHGSGQTLNPTLAFKGEDVNPLLDQKGSVFAVLLPAGKYTISGWQINVGAVDVRSSSYVSIKFNVSANEAIYLGNFDFHVTDTFMRNPTQAVVTLSEKKERDVSAFMTLYPKLASTPINEAIGNSVVVHNVGGAGIDKIYLPLFVPARH